MKELKSNFNYKFLNVLIVVLIIFLIYLMKGLWLGVFGKIIAILTPFIIGFAIAYALYPLLKKLRKWKFPKILATILIWLFVFLFLILIVWLFIPSILPVLFDQTTSLFNNIIKFVQDLSNKFDLNLASIKDSLMTVGTKLTTSIGEYISTGTISVINKSISIISNTIIALIAAIYFLYDMENIRGNIRRYLFKKSKKTYLYVETLDKQFYQYFNGMLLYIIIQIFEYTFLYFIIGHPNYLLLGILAAVTTIIPYFGNVITNVIAIITAAVISPKLLILTLIVGIVMPTIDGNLISPKIYKKTNKIPALLTVFAVFAGGVLWGLWGIVICLPITIIIMTTLRFYRKDINEKIEEIKSRNL
ncbi:MAG: AI-2E family transporter [Bacilli bacterium]|nr:AI-2E family transporter [Bacilli bacterium]